MDVFVPIHFAEAAEDASFVVYAHEMSIPEFMVTESMFPVDVVEFRNCMHVACLLQGPTGKSTPTDDPRVVFMHYASKFPPTLESRMWLWKEVVQLCALTRPVSMKTLPFWGHLLHLHTMAMDSKQLSFVQELQLMQTAIGIMVQQTPFVDNIGPLLAALNQHPKAHRARSTLRVIDELRDALRKANADKDRDADGHHATTICHEGYLFDLNIEARAARFKASSPDIPWCETLSWLIHGIFLAFTLTHDQLPGSAPIARYHELIQHAQLVSLHLSLCKRESRSSLARRPLQQLSHYEANARLVDEAAIHVQECCAAVAGDMRLANRLDIPVEQTPGSALWVCLADNFELNPIAYTFANLFLELEARQLISLTARASIAVAFIKGLMAASATSPSGDAGPFASSAGSFASSKLVLEAALKLPPLKPSAARLQYAYNFPTIGTRRMATFVDSEKEMHTLAGGFFPCDPFKIMTRLPCLGTDPLIALDSLAHFSNVMARHTSEFGLDGPVQERLRIAARLAFFGITHAYSMLCSNKEMPMLLHATMRLSGTLEGMVLGLAHHLNQQHDNTYRKGHLGNIGNPSTRNFLSCAPTPPPVAVPSAPPPYKSPPFWKSLGQGKRVGHGNSTNAILIPPLLIIDEDETPPPAASQPTVNAPVVNAPATHAQQAAAAAILDKVLEILELGTLANPPTTISSAYLDKFVAYHQRIAAAAKPMPPRAIIQLIDGPVESDFIFLDDGARFHVFDGMYTALSAHAGSSPSSTLCTVIFAPGMPHSKSTAFIDSRLKNVRGLLRRKEPSGFVVPIICTLTDDEARVRNALRILYANNVPPIRKSELVVHGKFALPLILPDTLDFSLDVSLDVSHSGTFLSPQQWICCTFESELRGMGLESRRWSPPTRSSGKTTSSSTSLQFVHEPPTNIFPICDDKIFPLAESIMARSAVINYTARLIKLSGSHDTQHLAVVTVQGSHYLVTSVATPRQPPDGNNAAAAFPLLWNTIHMHLQNREV